MAVNTKQTVIRKGTTINNQAYPAVVGVNPLEVDLCLLLAIEPDTLRALLKAEKKFLKNDMGWTAGKIPQNDQVLVGNILERLYNSTSTSFFHLLVTKWFEIGYTQMFVKNQEFIHLILTNESPDTISKNANKLMEANKLSLQDVVNLLRFYEPPRYHPCIQVLLDSVSHDFDPYLQKIMDTKLEKKSDGNKPLETDDANSDTSIKAGLEGSTMNLNVRNYEVPEEIGVPIHLSDNDLPQGEKGIDFALNLLKHSIEIELEKRDSQIRGLTSEINNISRLPKKTITEEPKYLKEIEFKDNQITNLLRELDVLRLQNQSQTEDKQLLTNELEESRSANTRFSELNNKLTTKIEELSIVEKRAQDEMILLRLQFTDLESEHQEVTEKMRKSFEEKTKDKLQQLQSDLEERNHAKNLKDLETLQAEFEEKYRFEIYQLQEKIRLMESSHEEEIQRLTLILTSEQKLPVEKVKGLKTSGKGFIGSHQNSTPAEDIELDEKMSPSPEDLYSELLMDFRPTSGE